MKNGITELVFILDKSGSMSGMETDTVGGFNAMIEKQKKVEGKVLVSTVLFSNFSEVLHDRKTLEEIEPLTEKDYQVGGCTALLDAIGESVNHISNIHKYARPEDVPEQTMFVITTDGMENASRTYSSKKVKEMIQCQEEKFGWKFLFLASNIDAVETAESIGVKRDCAVNYDVRKDTKIMYGVLSDVVCDYRRASKMSKQCASNFEEEMKKRKGK